MWVNDYGYSPVASLNLGVHLFNLTLSEVLSVKLEVLVAIGTTILFRPLNIHPENVYWKAVGSKVFVPFHYHVSADVGPLAEVESEHVQERHWDEA